MTAPSSKPRRRQSSPRKPVGKAKAAPARGRPTLYRADYAEQARRLSLLGQTDAEMAAFFGVSERTFHGWKKSHPDFLQSIKEGKADADAKVADALFQRAIGYSHPDSHISNYQGEITVTPITKHYPPDTGAAFIWLKNRQPDKWRDRIWHQADVTVSGPGSDELLRLFQERMQQARSRQEAVLAERGLLPAPDGD